MYLLCNDHLGSPLAGMKVHPSQSRMVGFSGARDEAFLWGWDSGHLQQLARFGSGRDDRPVRTARILGREVPLPGGELARDVAFHPDGVYMAIVGEDRPIEIRRISDGELIREIADLSGPVVRMIPFGWGIPLEFGYVPWEFTRCGFGHIAFSGSGRLFIAEARVYGFETGTAIGSLWEDFVPYATHPREDILAMVSSDQGGTHIRFARVQEPFRQYEQEIGWEPPRIRASDDEDEYGWFVPTMVNVESLVFSPSGDAFALSGGPGMKGDRQSVSVHDFPSLRLRFERGIEVSGEGLRPGWSMSTPIAFDLQGRRVYVPSGAGQIVALESMTGEEIGRWEAHAGSVTAFDVQQRTGTLVSSGLDGDVKVWRLPD